MKCTPVSLYSITSYAQLHAPQIKVQQTNGGIGIGTDNPRGIFDVGGGDIWFIRDGQQTSGESIYLPGNAHFIPRDNSDIAYLYALRSDNSGDTELQLCTSRNGSLNNALRINSFGGVGIGTTVIPNDHLLFVDGTTYSKEIKTKKRHFIHSVGIGTQPIKDFNLRVQGHVGIGNYPRRYYELSVSGRMWADRIEADYITARRTSWSDFVFRKDFSLRPLDEVERHILEFKHLPDIPSEEEVKQDGINLGDMDAKLLQKIEELTLYTIEQNKQILQLMERVERLESD